MSGGSASVLLKHNIKIGADSGTAVDVADVVTGLELIANRAIVEVPGTAATGTKSRRAGDASYELRVQYLTDDSASTLWTQFFDAIDTAAGTLYFEGTMGEGAVSATNPEWSGTFVVTGAALGANNGELLTDEQTFPLTGRPTKATS